MLPSKAENAQAENAQAKNDQEYVLTKPAKRRPGWKQGRVIIALLLCSVLFIPSVRLKLLLASATKMTFRPYRRDSSRSTGRELKLSYRQHPDLFARLRRLDTEFQAQPDNVADVIGPYAADVQSLYVFSWRLYYSPYVGGFAYLSGLPIPDYREYKAYLPLKEFTPLNQQLGVDWPPASSDGARLPATQRPTSIPVSSSGLK